MARASDTSSDSISLTSTAAESYDENQEYNVQEILAERQERDGTCRYLVKWEGYGEFDNTWEPPESFLHEWSLEKWEKQKQMIEKGLVAPFDVARWQERVDRRAAAKEKRQQRRAAKRKKLAASKQPSQLVGKSSNSAADKVVSLVSDSEELDDEENLPPIDESDSEDDDYEEEPTRTRTRARSSTASSQNTGGDSYDSESDDDESLEACPRLEKETQTGNHQQQQKHRANSGTNSEDASNASDDEPLIRRRALRKPAPAVNAISSSKGKSTDTISKSARPEVVGAKTHIRDESTPTQASPGSTAKGSKRSAIKDTTGPGTRDTSSQASHQGNAPHALQNSKRPSKRTENVAAKSPKDNAPAQSQSLPPAHKKPAPNRLPKPVLTDNWKDPPARRLKSGLKDGDKLFSKLSSQRRKEKRDLGERAPDTNANLNLTSLNTTAEPQTPVNSNTQQEDDHQGMVLDDMPQRVSSTTTVNAEQRTNDEVVARASPSLRKEGSSNMIVPREGITRQHTGTSSTIEKVPSPQVSTAGPTLRQAATSAIGHPSRDEAIRSPLSGTLGHFNERKSDRGSDRSDRGVDASKHTMAYAGAFRNLAIFESLQPLKGHLAFGGHILPVSCGMPNSAKFLVLDNIKQGANVHLRTEALINAEDYRRLLHADDEPLYYAIGTVYRKPGLPSDLDTVFKGFVQALKTRNSGAVYFHTKFAFLVWPAGHISWRFMDAKFPKPESFGLRYVLRVSAPIMPVVVAPLSLEREKKVRHGSTATLRVFIRLLIGVDMILITGRTRETRVFFLMLPEENRREHDILIQALRGLNYEVFTSYQEGHWKHFIDLVTGKKDQRKRQPGAALIHSSFTQIRCIPRMIRALQHGDVSFFTFHDIVEPRAAAKPGSLVQVSANNQDSTARPCRLSEIFPRDRGRAICLLDSFFIDGDQDDIRCLLSWFKNAFLDSSQFSWRLLVRPHVHKWLKEVALDRSRSNEEHPQKSAQDWIEIYHLVEALVPTERLSDIYDYEIADPREDPPLISFPRSTCPDLNWNHPVGETRGDTAVTRKNDKALFEWFGIWSTTELEHYRQFMVVSGEADTTKFKESSDKWSFESWQYIPLWPAKVFVHSIIKPKAEMLSRKKSDASLVQN